MHPSGLTYVTPICHPTLSLHLHSVSPPNISYILTNNKQNGDNNENISGNLPVVRHFDCIFPTPNEAPFPLAPSICDINFAVSLCYNNNNDPIFFFFQLPGWREKPDLAHKWKAEAEYMYTHGASGLTFGRGSLHGVRECLYGLTSHFPSCDDDHCIIFFSELHSTSMLDMTYRMLNVSFLVDLTWTVVDLFVYLFIIWCCFVP